MVGWGIGEKGEEGEEGGKGSVVEGAVMIGEKGRMISSGFRYGVWVLLLAIRGDLY